MILRFVPASLLTIAALLTLAGCADETPVDPPTGGTGNTTLAALYDTPPAIGSCSEGVLKQTERQKVLNYVNSIRLNHGLAPVQYRSADDLKTAKASLIIAASSTLSHTPPTSLTCWTKDGSDGSAVSNLAYNTSSGTTSAKSSETFIDMWMKDSTITSLGHRRWIINPFLKFISFGRVDNVTSDRTITGSALQVIYDEQAVLGASTPDFVAFPYHETSSRLFNSGIFMSFTAVASRTDGVANRNVGYSGATVTIRTEGGQSVPVTIVGSDNEGYGIPNVLLWTAPVVNDTKYEVTITGVNVDGTIRSFEYWFTTKVTV